MLSDLGGRVDAFGHRFLSLVIEVGEYFAAREMYVRLLYADHLFAS